MKKSKPVASPVNKKIQIIPVGKIWAIKNTKKVVLYTDKKKEAVQIATNLVKGDKSLIEILEAN